MSEARDQEIIHNLILARELRRQGPSWNRAFRRELWRRLGTGTASTEGTKSWRRISNQVLDRNGR